MRSHTRMVSKKNTTTIPLRKSRVSIDFSCIVSEIQNTDNSQRISPMKSCTSMVS
ncbi:hypothetical protein BHE74_00057749 [Ensete ventricosum]|nr:hypothetical protein BHE74_00057749 [Ensete ventricosum]